MKRRGFLHAAGLTGLGALAGPAAVLGQERLPAQGATAAQPRVVRGAEGKSVNVLGDHQVLKLAAGDTRGQLTAIVQDNPPNTRIPKHVHANEDEVFHLLEGEMEFEVGAQTVALKAGDLIFLPRGVPHSFRVVGPARAKTHLTVFPAGIEKMFDELSRLPAGPPDMPAVARICGRYGVRFV